MEKKQRGGKREGSGRHRLDPLGEKRNSKCVVVTDTELKQVQKFILDLRLNHDTDKVPVVLWLDKTQLVGLLGVPNESV